MNDDDSDKIFAEAQKKLVGQKQLPNLPHAYNGCHCVCHQMEGVKHVAACCGPGFPERRPLIKS